MWRHSGNADMDIRETWSITEQQHKCQIWQLTEKKKNKKDFMLLAFPLKVSMCPGAMPQCWALSNMWMWAAVSVLALVVTYMERAEECDSLLMALSQRDRSLDTAIIMISISVPPYQHTSSVMSPDIHTLTSYADSPMKSNCGSKYGFAYCWHFHLGKQ